MAKTRNILIMICLLVLVGSFTAMARAILPWVGSDQQMMEYAANSLGQSEMDYAMKNGYYWAKDFMIDGGGPCKIVTNSPKGSNDYGTADYNNGLSHIHVQYTPDLHAETLGIQIIIQGEPIVIMGGTTIEDVKAKVRATLYSYLIGSAVDFEFYSVLITDTLHVWVDPYTGDLRPEYVTY